MTCNLSLKKKKTPKPTLLFNLTEIDVEICHISKHLIQQESITKEQLFDNK